VFVLSVFDDVVRAFAVACTVSLDDAEFKEVLLLDARVGKVGYASPSDCGPGFPELPVVGVGSGTGAVRGGAWWRSWRPEDMRCRFPLRKLDDDEEVAAFAFASPSSCCSTSPFSILRRLFGPCNIPQLAAFPCFELMP
jgi:hypothetical protein